MEKDPHQLCVIPQNEFTGDTVRIVFANCSMATWSARLHAKTALCAALAFGRSLLVVPSGCVDARWFEDTTRMSMAVVVRKALCVHVGGAWGLQGCSLRKRREKCDVNTRENDVVAACLTPVSVWRDLLKNCQIREDQDNKDDHIHVCFF